MKFLENLKLAVFVGLLAGIIHGIIDIAARLIVWIFGTWSIEWFEFYQALLLSMLLFTLAFFFLGIFAGIARRAAKLKISKKSFQAFYFLSAAFLLFIFYAEIIVNAFIFPGAIISSPSTTLINLLILSFFSGMYIFFLTKGKSLVSSIISFLGRRKIKTIAIKIIAISILFIIFSLITDLFFLNYIPSTKYSESNKPNIVLISLTSVRADHLSLYGYNLETSPNIDQLSKNSVVFDNAFSGSSARQPSLTAIFTGKYPSSQELDYETLKLSDEEITLAEILKDNGYNTAGFTSDGLFKKKFGFAQGFNSYNSRLDFFDVSYTYHMFSFRETLNMLFPYNSLLGNDGERKAEEVNENAFKWIDKNKQKPFFLFIHYRDPHSPYKVQGEFTNINGPDDYENYTDEDFHDLGIQFRKQGEVPADVLKSMIKFYDNEIFYLDYHIGRLLNKLDELGIENNTIIMLTSVHGQEFFDHGSYGHEYILYNEVIRIPFIVYSPSLEPKRIPDAVSNADIFPTILDILDVEIPEHIESASLTPLIKKNKHTRDFVIAELFSDKIDKQIAVISKDWKLIEIDSKKRIIPSALYNLRTDPEERKNFYDIYPEKMESLKEYIPESHERK